MKKPLSKRVFLSDELISYLFGLTKQSLPWSENHSIGCPVIIAYVLTMLES
jgi:hypothetical protein